jgi:CRP/FNR family transcriptional regulator, anaerobic regulatory protein
MFMDKFSRLISSIDPIVSLTDEELSACCNSFEVKILNKNEFFLKEGQVCNYIGFINRGVLIYFKSKDNGNELTTDFAIDGDWVTVNLSRLNNSPSLISIKAIETSELLVIKQSDLSDLYISIPKLERLGRILIEQAYLKNVRQSLDLQTLSAKERYESLLHKFPEIFQKVPLYHIANYLGIAPKSLSRIRSDFFSQ